MRWMTKNLPWGLLLGLVVLACAIAPENAAAAEGLRISEVFFDPLLVADARGEFIEVVNVSRRAVPLSDVQLVLPSGKRLRLQRRARSALAPGEVVVVRPKPLVPARADEVVATGLRLPNRAGRLELWVGKRRHDVAQWWVKWPWPRAKPGTSLERKAPDSDGARGQAWRRSRTPLRVVERASPGVVHWQVASKLRRWWRSQPSSARGEVLVDGEVASTDARAGQPREPRRGAAKRGAAKRGAAKRARAAP